MGNGPSSKGRSSKNREAYRQRRTKNRSKDVDQVYDEIHKGKTIANSEIDPELPGCGQFPCIPCDRYFENADKLAKHSLSRKHKERTRELKQTPYSQREAEEAVGLGVDNGPKLNRGKVSSLPASLPVAASSTAAVEKDVAMA